MKKYVCEICNQKITGAMVSTASGFDCRECSLREELDATQYLVAKYAASNASLIAALEFVVNEHTLSNSELKRLGAKANAPSVRVIKAQEALVAAAALRGELAK